MSWEKNKDWQAGCRKVRPASNSCGELHDRRGRQSGGGSIRGSARRASAPVSPGGEAHQEAVVVLEVIGGDDGVVWLGGGVHLGQHLGRERLSHLQWQGERVGGHT